MRKIIKSIIILGSILGPLALCILILACYDSLLMQIAALIYLSTISATTIIIIIKNYKSLLLKLSLWPVYQTFTPPHHHTSDKKKESLYGLNQKIICFVGDSVTYGYDDDKNGRQLNTPWPQMVGAHLGCTVVNCGVSSASVLSHDSWTPIAWADEYLKIPCQADIIGLMIGINDCFRKYPLGTLDDKTTETFYGGLYTLFKGLKERFKPEEGKEIFLLVYPHYDALPDFKLYVTAMYEVAELFSIPICDLSLFLGVSPYNDSRYKYWRKYKNNEFHSPHMTQITADLCAKAVANYIYSHYNLS